MVAGGRGASGAIREEPIEDAVEVRFGDPGRWRER